jgi:soluble P-type ATPase
MEAAMALFAIPGQEAIEARHLVLDYNGTLARDGVLLPGVAGRLLAISQPPLRLTLHVLTADTHGTVAGQVADLPCRLAVIGPDRQDQAKLAYVRELGPKQTVAVGNGANDRLMLAEAVLGIAVIGREGAATAAMTAARVVCTDIRSALALLLTPPRLAATLRL